MDLKTNILLSTTYRDLKKLHIDKELINSALLIKNFNTVYKAKIKPFIKYLKNYKTKGEYKINLNRKILKNHVQNAIRDFIKNGNALNYISNVKDNGLEEHNIESYEIVNQQNFDVLFKYYGDTIFNEKVSNLLLSDISLNGRKLSELFQFAPDKLKYIAENDLIEGILYTYNNITESRNFIECQITGNFPLDQFKMDFIKKIGDDNLNILYRFNVFVWEKDYENLFGMYECGNIDLIIDTINYNKNESTFNRFQKEELGKSLIEAKNFDKVTVIFSKYFGIEWNEINYINLFLKSIAMANLTEEYKNKYEEILILLNKIFNSSKEELIELSKSIDLNNKDKYRKLIRDCERDGNALLRNLFLSTLKKKNDDVLQQARRETILWNDKNIPVYNLEGQNFTMLVHCIGNNNMSSNNDVAMRLLKEPSSWESTLGRNNFISTSLISERHMDTYISDYANVRVIYGFYDFPATGLMCTMISDGGIKRDAGKDTTFDMRRNLYRGTNTMLMPEDLISKTIQSKGDPNRQFSYNWNEVVISRENQATHERIRPDYILCMNVIDEYSKIAAAYFDIPIYVIHKKYYKDVPQNISTVDEHHSEVEMDGIGQR